LLETYRQRLAASLRSRAAGWASSGYSTDIAAALAAEDRALADRIASHELENTEFWTEPQHHG
jgi:hypothetical protein